MAAGLDRPVLQQDATGTAPPLRAEDRILRLLQASDFPLLPKIIAVRSRTNHNTARSTLRRLAQAGKVHCDKKGYFIIRNEFEQILDVKLKIDGQRECLPRVHDIHLTFKTENLRKALCQQDKFEELRSSFIKHVQDRGPDSSEAHKSLIPSCKEIASLPLCHLREVVLDPKNPNSIHQLWKRSTTLGSSVKKIKGGFQETIPFESWKLIIQIYERTGTIKVILSNSQHPFDAIGLRSAISEVNGVFKAKTGLPFLDIAALFYIEKIHVGSDVLEDAEFSGIARTCCTVKQFEGWLFRTYEKVLGGQLYIRNEVCQEGGSYEDNQVNTLLPALDRQLVPTPSDLIVYDIVRWKDTAEVRISHLERRDIKQREFNEGIIETGILSSSSPAGNPFRVKPKEKEEKHESSFVRQSIDREKRQEGRERRDCQAPGP